MNLPPDHAREVVMNSEGQEAQAARLCVSTAERAGIIEYADGDCQPPGGGKHTPKWISGINDDRS